MMMMSKQEAEIMVALTVVDLNARQCVKLKHEAEIAATLLAELIARQPDLEVIDQIRVHPPGSRHDLVLWVYDRTWIGRFLVIIWEPHDRALPRPATTTYAVGSELSPAQSIALIDFYVAQARADQAPVMEGDVNEQPGREISPQDSPPAQPGGETTGYYAEVTGWAGGLRPYRRAGCHDGYVPPGATELANPGAYESAWRQVLEQTGCTARRWRP
jgi:hypothetical protein